jgi:hypothetical protein
MARHDWVLLLWMALVLLASIDVFQRLILGG